MGCLAGLVSMLLGVRQPVWLLVNSLAVFSVAALLSAWWLDARSFRDGLASGLLRALQARRRQYAGFVIHMGLFSLAIGVAASSFGTQRHEAIMHVGRDARRGQDDRCDLSRSCSVELPEKLIVEARLDVQDRIRSAH